MSSCIRLFLQGQHWQSEFSPRLGLLSLPSGNSLPSDDHWNRFTLEFTKPFRIQFFICISPVRSVFLLTSLFRRRHWSSEKWNDLSKAAQEVKEGMTTGAQPWLGLSAPSTSPARCPASAPEDELTWCSTHTVLDVLPSLGDLGMKERQNGKDRLSFVRRKVKSF